MPSPRARGTARGGLPDLAEDGPLTALTPEGFRCSLASQDRGDDPAGTATHLRAFLLLEHQGPWGASAPRDSRLPDEVKRHLAGQRSIKVLLARRHHKAHRSSTYRVVLCLPARRLLLTTTFEDPVELCDVDLDGVVQGRAPDWERLPGPLFGVCTHGRHDACCAERGRPVCRALTEASPEETWEVSHVGGDRFAPNMVVLPEGLYYGRLDPDSVVEVAALHRAGRLDLDRFRGRATYPMPVQYAEIALRRQLGEDRLDALRLVSRDGETSEFARGEERWRVTVLRTLTDDARLTCSAARPGPVPVFDTVSIERA